MGIGLAEECQELWVPWLALKGCTDRLIVSGQRRMR